MTHIHNFWAMNRHGFNRGTAVCIKFLTTFARKSHNSNKLAYCELCYASGRILKRVHALSEVLSSDMKHDLDFKSICNYRMTVSS